MYGTSFHDRVGRMQQMAHERAMLEAQQHQRRAAYNARQNSMLGFEAQRAAEAAERAQYEANARANYLYSGEQAAQANREMMMAEREQQLKYEQMARETAARQQDSALKYQAMNNMTSSMPGLVSSIGGQYQQQTPSVNLYDRDGQRIGGSSLRRSLLG